MKRACVVVLLAVVAATVAARPPAYTLEECIDIGLQRSGRLHNALRDERIADASVGQVRAGILPHLSASAAYTRLDAQETVVFGGQPLKLGEPDNYSAGIDLRQLLYSGGSMRAGLRAAKDYRAMTEYHTAQVRAGLVRDIHAGFYDLLLLQSVVRVHEQAVAQLRAVLDQTEQRFRQDQAAEFDVFNARIRLANALPGLLRASNDWSVARMAFADLVQLDDPDFVIKGELRHEPFAGDPEELVLRALEQRPEILAMNRRLVLQQADIRVEQGAYRPSLYLTASYRGQDPAGMIAADDGWEWRWNAGVQMQWNWWDGGLRRHRVRQKRLEYEKSLENRAIMRRALELEVRRGWLRLEHAAAAADASRETVALAVKTLDIARTQYETGLTTRLEYTEVSLALMQARLHWLQALRDHEHAVNEVRFATGEYRGAPFKENNR